MAAGVGSSRNSNLTLLGLLFLHLKIVFAALGDTWEFISREAMAAGSVSLQQSDEIHLPLATQLI